MKKLLLLLLYYRLQTIFAEEGYQLWLWYDKITGLIKTANKGFVIRSENTIKMEPLFL